MADIDASFMQGVFETAQRQRKSDVHLWTPLGRQVKIWLYTALFGCCHLSGLWVQP